MSKNFEELKEIIQRLRDPQNGCPWDLEQTHQSLKPNLIEEAYEVLDAIDLNSTEPKSDELKKELGDLLLQVMLHSQIARDNKHFTIDDVISELNNKLIRRHPHVFGENKANDAKQAIENWEKAKQKENNGKKSMLDGVPRAMPALQKAQRVSEKAARVGFEWENLEGVRDQILEEIAEFTEASIQKDINIKHVEEEFGDILFALVQLARRLNFNSEDLLQKATDKFIRRFKAMEQSSKKPLSESTLPEMDKLWKEAKLQVG